MANISVTVGAVNFTDFVHFTLSKVSSPTTIVWEHWESAPFTNYTFVIPNVDADDYFLRAYDAATNSALGTLVSECFVAAGNSAFEYEFRFYTGGDLPAGASLNAGGDVLTDNYLNGKTIHTVHKEGFRPLDPADEFTMVGDDLTLLNTTLADLEKLVVVIKNKVVGTATSGGLYSGMIDLVNITETLTSGDKNKLVRLLGANIKQAITLPSLATLSVDDGFYFDNSVGGVAKQPKFLTDNTDRIRFNGFNAGSAEFAEFWVDKGKKLYLKKYDDDFWEVRNDYDGVHVGESFFANYLSHPNTIPGDGRIGLAAYDGDEFGKIWYWLNNILPSTHRISDSGINATSYVHPAGKEGMWVIHPSLKLFRPPNTQGWSIRLLKNFTSYGAGTDADRTNNYPGGSQPEKMKKFWPGTPTRPAILKIDGANTTDDTNSDTNEPNIVSALEIDTTMFASEIRLNNIGKIELYRI